MAPSSPSPAGMLNEGCHLLAERTGVLLVEIDLVVVPPTLNCSVSFAGPPSRSSSRVTVIFCAIQASLAAIGYLHGTDLVSCLITATLLVASRPNASHS
jgi:hypothetical protein